MLVQHCHGWRGIPVAADCVHQPPATEISEMIKAIKFASVPVRDQDRAIAFWTEKMGFAVATDQPFGDGRRWIELRIPGADTRLVLFTPDGHENRIGTFAALSFVADNVQKTYEELKAKGVVFKGPPDVQEWGTSAIFDDPDGNSFVMSSK
jgi:catechol 2,3-dioxygenase-like lactoylglutathione lyase family enzyme